MLSSTWDSLASKGMTQMLITASWVSLLKCFRRTEARACFAGLIRSPDPCAGPRITEGPAGLRLLLLQTVLFLLPATQSPNSSRQSQA